MSKTNNTADAIFEALEDYNEEIAEKVKKGVGKIAYKTFSRLQRDRNIPSRTGEYKRSFRLKRIGETEWGVTYRINNLRYQLTHLLENGHEIVDNRRKKARYTGKQSKAFPHWETAEREVNQQINELVYNLTRGSK